MNNQIRIMRHGLPTYVAPWVKTLTHEGQRMIGQTNIMVALHRDPSDAAREQRRKYREAMDAMQAARNSSYAIAAE